MDAAALRSHIIGTWHLVSMSDGDPSDSSSAPWGSSPQGIILYTTDGYVSVHMQKPGQAPYASEDFMCGTDAECAKSARNYSAYCGPFKIEQEEGGRLILWHTLELSFFPNWKGVAQKRVAKLDIGQDGKGDTLTLSTGEPISAGGAQKHLELVWKRKVQESMQEDWRE